MLMFVGMKVVVIIPTLNEQLCLDQNLATVSRLEKGIEIIIVDGGSTDQTLEIVHNFNVKIINAKRGRGSQLDAGAKTADGDVFWFLHADTLPPPDAIKEIKTALEDKNVVGGNFEIRFDGDKFASKFLTWLYPKFRWLGLCYGDSAFFVRCEIYEKSGGFRDWPLFEDVDFYKRVRKYGRFVHLKSQVVSSSRRFEKRSFVLTFARWSLFQGLYWIGVSPEFLAKYYAPIRK